MEINTTAPRAFTLLRRILVACAIVALAAPVARAQPGPGSEIAFTLSYFLLPLF